MFLTSSDTSVSINVLLSSECSLTHTILISLLLLATTLHLILHCSITIAEYKLKRVGAITHSCLKSFLTSNSGATCPFTVTSADMPSCKDHITLNIVGGIPHYFITLHRDLMVPDGCQTYTVHILTKCLPPANNLKR